MSTGSQSNAGNGPNPSNSAPSPSGNVEETAQIVKERAGAMLDDAKETARSTLNEQKDVAAGGIDDVAGALRDAAKRREKSEGRDNFANLTESAADGLERVSGALRNKDVGTMLRDMESFARGQPIAFFGLALAAGFLAVRFLKATDSHRDSQYPSASDAPYTGGASRLETTSSYQEDPWTTR